MVSRRKGTKWRAGLTRLRPLLEAVYHQSLAHPLDSLKLKKGLEDLLLFLSGEGRSHSELQIKV
jgi:hypothetical protein